ncbi:MAG: hypothetical protein GY861_18580 [bacterium]|nr:hypothetical protein [bacterium]
MNESEFSLSRTITVPTPASYNNFLKDQFIITRRWEKMPTDKEIEEWEEKQSKYVKKVYMKIFYEAIDNRNEAKEEPKKSFVKQAGPAKSSKVPF